MIRAGLLVAGFAGLATVWLVTTPDDAATPKAVLILGLVIALVTMTFGVHRSRTERGRFDPFHPQAFPAAYIAVSFLAPTWAYYVDHERLLGFTSTSMSPETPRLMLLAAAAALAGLSVPFNGRNQGRETGPLDARTLVTAGRALLAIPLIVGTYNVAAGGAASKGVGQTAVTTLDTINVAAHLAAPLAALLILLGHQLQGKRLLLPADWALVGTVVALVGLSGSRAPAIALLIIAAYAYAAARASIKPLAIVLGVGLAFAIAVLSYRTAAVGGTYDQSVTTAVLTDFSPAAYTTGITARGVPIAHDYEMGATYIDAAIRQIPSPIANRLVGPPTDTGTNVFRELIGFTNPNHGYGFSLPAEGYLNFGTWGLVAACFLFGLLLAWAYPRSRWPAADTIGLLYPILIAAMPIAIRSDAIGLIKSGLYPMVLAAAVFTVAHSAAGRRQGTSSSSRPSSADPGLDVPQAPRIPLGDS